jgi:hypothetical protein
LSFWASVEVAAAFVLNIWLLTMPIIALRLPQ